MACVLKESHSFTSTPCIHLPSVSFKETHVVTKKNWSNFDLVQFARDHSSTTELDVTPCDDVDYLFNVCRKMLAELIDKHALQCTSV